MHEILKTEDSKTIKFIKTFIFHIYIYMPLVDCTPSNSWLDFYIIVADLLEAESGDPTAYPC